MVNIDKYPDIVPGTCTVKNAVTGLFLYFLGMAIQTAYRIDPGVRMEIDKWPDTFIFLFSVINGPRMVIQKRSGNVQYLGQKETFRADVELCFKNPEFAFMVMTGQTSTQAAIHQNRQFVKGDLNLMMSIIRVMSRTQAILFPRFIAKRYINQVPPFSWILMRNRFLVYLNCLLGIIK